MIRTLAYTLFFSLSINASIAQNISSECLLHNLHPYWTFLNSLKEEVEDTSSTKYSITLEQGYSFITIELRSKRNLLMHVQMQIQQKEIKIYKFYCSEKKYEKSLKKRVEKLEGEFEWKKEPETKFKLIQKAKEYLAIADRIAAEGNDLSAYPTDYREVIITESTLILDQSNHYNSRSLDHKDDYYLRNLTFTIPLDDHYPKNEFTKIGSYFIGNMEIVFGDGSSEKNQITGDEIEKQIKIELENYNHK